MSLLSSVKVVKHCPIQPCGVSLQRSAQSKQNILPAATTTFVGHWSAADKNEIKKETMFKRFTALMYLSDASLHSWFELPPLPLISVLTHLKPQIMQIKFSATSQMVDRLSWSAVSARGALVSTRSMIWEICVSSKISSLYAHQSTGDLSDHSYLRKYVAQRSQDVLWEVFLAHIGIHRTQVSIGHSLSIRFVSHL